MDNIMAVNQHLYLFYWNSVPFFSLYLLSSIIYMCLYCCRRHHRHRLHRFSSLLPLLLVLLLLLPLLFVWWATKKLLPLTLRSARSVSEICERNRKKHKLSHKHTHTHTQQSTHMKWISPVWIQICVRVCILCSLSSPENMGKREFFTRHRQKQKESERRKNNTQTHKHDYTTNETR